MKETYFIMKILLDVSISWKWTIRIVNFICSYVWYDSITTVDNIKWAFKALKYFHYSDMDEINQLQSSIESEKYILTVCAS